MQAMAISGTSWTAEENVTPSDVIQRGERAAGLLRSAIAGSTALPKSAAEGQHSLPITSMDLLPGLASSSRGVLRQPVDFQFGFTKHSGESSAVFPESVKLTLEFLEHHLSANRTGGVSGRSVIFEGEGVGR